MAERDKWRQVARRLGPRADELEADARRLCREFEQGDMLAPFECCAMWEAAGLDFATLPDWVINRLAEISAVYYRDGSFALYDPDEPEPITPRQLIEMSPKARKKVISSLDTLDKIAGLAGVRGKPNAWLWRAEHGRDEYVAAYLDKLEQQARNGNNTWKIPDEQGRGRTMPILDNHGRLHDAVRHEVGCLFHVGGLAGEGWNKAKTVSRRVKRTKARADK